MAIRFFKLPSHQQFEYKPRYWDQRKEELQERVRRAEEGQSGSNDNDPEAVKRRLSGSFRRGGYNAQYGQARRNQVRRSNLTLLGIVAALCIMVYYVFYVYLPRIVAVLEAQKVGFE